MVLNYIYLLILSAFNLAAKVDSAKAGGVHPAAKSTLSLPQLIGQTFHKILGWGKTGFQYIPNFIAAVIVILIFYFIGRLLRKLTARLLHQATDNRTVVDLVETTLGIILVAVGIFLALGILNLTGIVATLLAGAGIVALALGFAFRDIASNFIAGVFITIHHPFDKGDIIKSQGYFGTVVRIRLRATLIRTPQGQIVYIPNSKIYNDPLVNYSEIHLRRVDLMCRISYAEDLEKARRAAVEAVKNNVRYHRDRDIQFVYREFDKFAIKFQIRFWVDYSKNMDYLTGQSQAIMAITKKFREENITIPFPIRTLDFGIRGGEKLDAMLDNRNQGIGE